jgi:hypothetical protein
MKIYKNLLKVLSSVALAMAFSSCGLTPQQPVSTAPATLEGSWQLVKEEVRINGNSIPTFDPKTHKMTKIFNKTHFAFTSIGPNRPRFSSYSLTDAEKVVAFENFGGGAGRYSYENGYLTEHIEHMNYPNYEGVSITFKITLEGDTLIQEGDYPIRELGLGESNGYLYSVFKRIE